MWELFLAGLGYKAVQVWGAWAYLSIRKRKRLLMGSDKDPIGIPILDEALASRTGEPNKLEALATKKIVGISRFLVNTKAFEHGVALIVNHNSAYRLKDTINSDVSIEL